MRPPGSPQELERRRSRPLAMLAAGDQPVDVARRLGADRRSVQRWKAAYGVQGAAGVRAKPAPARLSAPGRIAHFHREELHTRAGREPEARLGLLPARSTNAW